MPAKVWGRERAWAGTSLHLTAAGSAGAASLTLKAAETAGQTAKESTERCN